MSKKVKALGSLELDLRKDGTCTMAAGIFIRILWLWTG